MVYIAVGLAVVMMVVLLSRREGFKKGQRQLTAIAAIGLSVMVLSGCGNDQEQAQLNEKLEAKNAAVVEANQTLKDELVSLQEEIDELKEELKGQAEEKVTAKESLQSLQKENATLAESITTLKTQNEKLTKTVGEKDKTIQQLKEKTSTTAASASPATQGASSNTSSSGSSGQANSQPANTTSSQAECTIKGSNTGIYHVPGSTYYSRTKNVAQWFCSAEEAESAGYRPPKR